MAKSKAASGNPANVAGMIRVGTPVEAQPTDLSYLDNVVSAAPGATIGEPVSEGNPEVATPTEQPANPDAQPQPGQAEPGDSAAPEASGGDLDDPRFKGKSPAEILKAYKNLESEVGKHRNEVGEMRRFFDQYVMNQMRQQNGQAQPGQPGHSAPATPQVDDAELLSRLLTKPSEVLAEIRQSTRAELEAARQGEIINQIKAQNIQTIQDPNFLGWLRANVPPSIIQRLDHNPSELIFTLNQYKQLNPASTQPAPSVPPTPASPASARRDVHPGVAAGTGTSTSAPSKQFSRGEIRNMIMNEPEKYQRMLPEIERAYAEGRVKG